MIVLRCNVSREVPVIVSSTESSMKRVGDYGRSRAHRQALWAAGEASRPLVDGSIRHRLCYIAVQVSRSYPLWGSHRKDQEAATGRRVHRQVRHPQHLHLRPMPARRAERRRGEAAGHGRCRHGRSGSPRQIRKEHHEEFLAQKEAAEKKKKTTITAESFDKQVAHKMGEFFDDVFLPNLKKLVEAGLSYDKVKSVVRIPSTWGAKITGEQFEQRVSAYLSK